MIYYLTILFLFLFSFLNHFRLDKFGINLLIAAIFIFFIFLGGFRFEVGADWGSYRELFINISNWNDLFYTRVEPLFMLFGFLTKNIMNNYSFFIFIFFTVSFSLKFNFIRVYSPDIFLSLIIYFFTLFLIYDVNGLRQGMALGLTLFSTKYILNRNNYKFLLILLIACLFHTSAIIFIPFYYLSRIKISNRILSISLFLIVALSIPLRYFFKNSELFQSLILIDSFKHYSVYTTSEDYKLDIPILSVAVFQRIFIMLFFILSYQRIKVEENVKLLFRNAYFIGIVLFLLFSFSSEFAARLSFYYKAFEIAMIPLIVYSFPRFHQKIILLLLFTCLAIFGTYRLLSIPYGYLLPYNNLLFK